MKPSLKRRLLIALCCLPGIALAVAIGISLRADGAAVTGWLGWGIGLLPIVAFPAAMGLMMWWISRDIGGTGSTHKPRTATEQLAALRIQEQLLVAQVAAEHQATVKLRPAANEHDSVPAQRHS